MHVLVLPSFYPDESNKNLGSFFKEQVKTISSSYVDVNVVYLQQKSLRKLSIKNLRNNYFQSTLSREKSWLEYMSKGWKLPTIFGDKIWIYLTGKLVDKYITKHGKPDIIHVHNVYLAGIVANNIKKKYKVPFVITEHSSVFLRKDFLTKSNLKIASEVFNNASKIIVVSESLKKRIGKLLPVVKIEILPNMVDTSFFRPLKKANNRNYTNFISVGNLDKNKNHSLLIDAFFNLSKTIQNIDLKICGEGPEKQNLQNKILNLKIGNKIELMGFQNRNELLEMYRKADCLVHTSNYETFGVVIIEALSCGLPFISTRSGGPEDIYEKSFGFLVDCNDAVVLKESMMRFINEKDDFSKEIIRNRTIYIYSHQVFLKAILKIYNEALKVKVL